MKRTKRKTEFGKQRLIPRSWEKGHSFKLTPRKKSGGKPDSNGQGTTFFNGYSKLNRADLT